MTHMIALCEEYCDYVFFLLKSNLVSNNINTIFLLSISEFWWKGRHKVLYTMQESSGLLLWCYFCHFESCQTLSSLPFISGLVIKKNHILCSREEEKSYWNSMKVNANHFCFGWTIPLKQKTQMSQNASLMNKQWFTNTHIHANTNTALCWSGCWFVFNRKLVFWDCDYSWSPKENYLLFFFSCYKSYLIISVTEHKTFPVLLTKFLSLGFIKDSSVFSDEAWNLLRSSSGI